MNKVICDICGTTYPENAAQCPICGYSKPENPELVVEEIPMEATRNYTYQKGGRFSNANVRKRNKVAAAAVPVDYQNQAEVDDDDDEDIQEEDQGSSKGLIVILVLLIVAILALILYLYFNFFAPVGGAPKETESLLTTTTAALTETKETEAPTVPCTELSVSETNIVLDAIGNAWLLNVVASPEDTTDSVSYVSSDEAVATVSSEGCVTAAGPGEAVITVTCGDVVVLCNVTCNIETEPATEATEATTEATEAAGTWTLNREDFTITVGEKWNLYEGDVSVALITFTSNDTAVATVKNGVVTAVGTGRAIITAEYNGQKIECIARVKSATPATEATTAPDSGDGAVG